MTKLTATNTERLKTYCKESGLEFAVAINKLLDKQLNLEEITYDYLVDKYKNIADFDILDIMAWDGENLFIKPSDQWPKKYKGAHSPIAGLKLDKGVLEVKIHDKLKASESLAKHLGMFGEFNIAVGTLKKYGIELEQDTNGKWVVIDDLSPVQGELFC